MNGGCSTTSKLRAIVSVALACALAAALAAAPATPAAAELSGKAVAIAADPLGPGYWILMADGRVIPRGSARDDGRAAAFSGRATGLASYPTGKGFWRARSNGAVRGFGSATHETKKRPDRDSRVVGVAAHYRGAGLWRVTAEGQVMATGDTSHYGRVSTTTRVRAVAGHPTAAGYWAVDRTGKVFAFGAAAKHGDAAEGATGITAHPSGRGYWVAHRDGTVTAHGAAQHYGNASLDVAVVDITAAPDGGGYWILARDGRVRAFGSAKSGVIITEGPPTPELATVRGITVATSLERPLRRLLRRAEDAGIRYGGWGYRSYTRQVELRQLHCGVRYYDVFVKSSSECSPMTAIPGRSMHERGLAIDFFRYRDDGSTAAIAGTRAFRWLKNHAADYGLYNLPSEPWHWSTTGG